MILIGEIGPGGMAVCVIANVSARRTSTLQEGCVEIEHMLH